MILIWWLWRQAVKRFCRDWWPYCQHVNPYDSAVRQKAQRLKHISSITEFIASIPWKAEKGDTWHSVAEVLANPDEEQDCEEHAYTWLSLALAVGYRGKVRCVSGKVYGQYRHLWSEIYLHDEWWVCDTRRLPYLFRYQDSTMGHEPEFWFTDLQKGDI